MLTSTFQLAAGLGPRREQQLWQAGVARWEDYSSWQDAGAAMAGPTLPGSTLPGSTLPGSTLPGATLPGCKVRWSKVADLALRSALRKASAAFAARDVERLAEQLPSGEHWRLFEAFGEDAAYLDIETSDDAVGCAGISAIGVLDRRGPQLLLAGRDLEHFAERAQGWSMLVTFNGLSFDLPIVRRAFPDWRPPLAHIDLRHVLARLGHTGGLKAIERRLSALHLTRPAHLAGLHGANACGLFRRGQDGDREALLRFAEYNLYDVINLRTLMAYAYNALVEAYAARAPALRAADRKVAVPGRGDVLYDVSKILLAL